MRSPAVAIAWEFRQRYRWGLTALAGYLVALGTIKLLILTPGPPVDIERSTVCRYCQAPIMALDPDAVEKALHDLDAAERQRVAPDPDKIGDSIVALARLQREMDDARRRDGAEINGIDLVGIGLSALGAFLKWR